MALTYLLLDIAFTIVVLIIIGIKKRSLKVVLLSLMILGLLTAVFDSLIVHFDIVSYAYEKTLNIKIGYAPIEDFFYVILAVLIVPRVWERLEK